MYNIFVSDFEHISACRSVIGHSEDNHKNEYCHNNYEILLFVRGNARYIVEGKEYTASEDSVIVLRPLTYYCVFIEEGKELEYISVRFDANLLSAAVSSMLDKILTNEEQSRFYSVSSFDEAVMDAFYRTALSCSLSRDSAAEYLKLITAEIIILLSSESSEGTEISEHELGARVIRYLNSNIEKNVSLDKLARRFFVSKFYLCRAFKKYSGTSVHSYINHKRIMYAKQLIDSGISASKAAYEVGFGDYSAFYRAYVKMLGKSPTAN